MQAKAVMANEIKNGVLNMFILLLVLWVLLCLKWWLLVLEVPPSGFKDAGSLVIKYRHEVYSGSFRTQISLFVKYTTAETNKIVYT